MSNILIHIAGPTGSGKTSLGNLIKDKFPFLLVKDLDEIFKDLPAVFLKEFKEINHRDKFYRKYLDKGLSKFVSDHKDSIIVFVGFNGFNDFDEKKIQYSDILAKHKYYIQISEKENLERRFNRQIDRINNKRKFYFEKTLNVKPLCIDFDKWKEKINSNDLTFYKNNGYLFMNNDQIYKSIKKILLNYLS